MEEQTRNFKGVWIPKDIWLNNDLTPLEKMYLVEIDSLDNEDDGCYASNKHFKTMFGQSSNNATRIIKSLKEKGWISINYERNGKEIVKRIIKVNKPPYPKRSNNEGTYSKNENGVLSKLEWGTLKMRKRDIHRDIQLDNNTTTTISERDGNKRNGDENLFEFVEKTFGRPLGDTEIEMIGTWKDNSLTRYAIKQAELARVFNVKYINKILYSYQKEGITTVAEAEEREKIFQESKTTGVNKSLKDKIKLEKWDNVKKEKVSDKEREELEELFKDFREEELK